EGRPFARSHIPLRKGRTARGLFPAPVARVTTESHLWDWVEVASWMFRRGRSAERLYYRMRDANRAIEARERLKRHRLLRKFARTSTLLSATKWSIALSRRKQGFESPRGAPGTPEASEKPK